MDCPSCRAPCEAVSRSCPACGSPLPPGIGTLVAGRFELLAALGAGGMGTVLRARDRKLELEVALKVLRLGRDPSAVRRFHSEVRLARCVKHRNVCGIHEYGEDGELVFCVMELCSGRNLRQLLQEVPLGWDEAFRIALEAAAGLQAIHEAGVVHRDVKASNLMIDAHGHVRLVDFGIAKAQPSGERDGPSRDGSSGSLDSLTDAHLLVGSPEYMSPEQVRGAEVDARSDLYSFGIVLYEMFAGRLPFSGANRQQVMLRRLEQPPSFDGAVAATLPPALVPVLRKALAKEPHHRQRSMSELIDELRAAAHLVAEANTEAVASPVAGPGRATVSWQRFRSSAASWIASRPALAALLATRVALAALVMLAVVIAVLVIRRPAARKPGLSAPAATAVAAAPGETTATRAQLGPPATVERSDLRPRPAVPASSGEPSPAPPVGSASVTSARTQAAEARTQAADALPGGSTRAENEPLEETEAASPPSVALPPATLPSPAGHTRSPVAAPVPGLVTIATTTTTLRAPQRGDLLATGDPEVVPARCRGGEIRYCPQAESLRIEGQVVIEVLVDEEGRVSQPVPVRWDDEVLKRCGLRSLSRLSCEPAHRRGVPGKMRLRVVLDFRLPR